MVHFEAQAVPELATMASTVGLAGVKTESGETGEKGNGPHPTQETGR